MGKLLRFRPAGATVAPWAAEPTAAEDGGGEVAGGEVAGRSDEELALLTAGGLVDAYAELVRRWEKPVRGYSAKWCGAARADDLAQEVFWSIWRARSSYRPGGRFAAYLFTIVRNQCRNESRARAVRLEPPPAFSSVKPDQLEELLQEERQRRVNAQVLALPPKLREALLLRFVGDLDYREIAAIIDAPEGTARSRVFLALARLRDELLETDR